MPPFLIELIWVVAVLATVGVLLWVLERLTFISEPFKSIIRVLIIGVAAIWVIWELFAMATGSARPFGHP